jgi:hypothetical protein
MFLTLDFELATNIHGPEGGGSRNRLFKKLRFKYEKQKLNNLAIFELREI